MRSTCDWSGWDSYIHTSCLRAVADCCFMHKLILECNLSLRMPNRTAWTHLTVACVCVFSYSTSDLISASFSVISCSKLCIRNVFRSCQYSRSIVVDVDVLGVESPADDENVCAILHQIIHKLHSIQEPSWHLPWMGLLFYIWDYLLSIDIPRKFVSRETISTCLIYSEYS